MSVVIGAPSGAVVCVGCLSVDRKLTTIHNLEQKKYYFSQLLDSMWSMSEHLALCWECAALLRRSVRFRGQVQTAAALMKNYYEPSKPLSRLRVSETKAMLFTDTDYPTEPMAFIKIEHEENIFSEETDIYDRCASDKDSGGEMKTDQIEMDALMKNSRGRSGSLDSDDIPLKLWRSDNTTEEVEKRVKKQRRSRSKRSEKIDRRKCPGPKKEKPAGVVNNKRVNKKLEELNVDSSQVQMVVLSWEQVEEERQKALASVEFTRHAYKCYDCALGFNHKFKLENHMKKHDESAGAARCALCGVRFRSAHALGAHRRRHRVRWACAACGRRASRAAVAADHVARAHGAAAATHLCSVCGHVAQTLGKLRIHLKNHMERQKCELCGKTFRDRTSLRTHLFIHNGEKEYGCPQCDKKFLFKKAMEIHLVTHQAPAGLYCRECDMNFKNQMSYYQHMKYNLKHIDPAKLKYACEACGKRFVKAARLEEHRLAVHLKATPVRCQLAGCSFACSSRPVLRTHIRMVHRNFRSVRNHVCDACGKAYTTKKTLEGHMRTHTGERPFKCQQCPSTFGYEAALYNHNKLVHLKAKAGRARAAPPPPPAPSPPAPGPSWGRAGGGPGA